MSVEAKVYQLDSTTPGAGVDEDVFQVGANKEFQFKLIISNRSTTPAMVRIYLSTAGKAGLLAKENIAYDVQIDQDNPKTYEDLILNSTISYLTVRASTVNVSFNAVGLERDV